MAVNVEKYSQDTSDEGESDSEQSILEENIEATDKQLQKAFSEGYLKPGLNFIAQPQKECVNDPAGLKDALAELKQNIEWVERLDVTCGPGKAPGSTEKEEETDDVEDYFKRELRFYRQAQAAVLEAIPKLHKLNIPTRRPDDYFAEMAKSDSLMKRVRQKLLVRELSMAKSAKAKKLRELRKFGKQVQQEVLQARQKEKVDLTKKLKAMSKGKMKDTKEELVEQQQRGRKRKLDPKETKSYNPLKKVNKKRQYKDERFGYGGRKRGKNHNTRESHNADDDGFRARRNREDPSNVKGKNSQYKNVRKGKNRRKAMNRRKKNSR